jgi:peptidyl-prolyl cis-trans isomerase SurA
MKFFALFFATLISVYASAETVERIVAVVNDEIIAQTDVDKYAARLKTGGLADDLLIPDEATKQSLLKDRAKLLETMINAKVIDSEVKKQNMSVPIEKVEQEIRKVAKNNNVSRDELKSALLDRGIPFSDYQDFIKTGLERQSLVEKAIASRIKISEDDVISAYSARTGNSEQQAFEYTLAHIYFDSSKGGAKAARQRADEALAKLKSGVAWEREAADASEDPGYEQGGLLGVFKTGELQKDLDAAVSKLQPNEMTGVITANGGFEIVKVLKKKLIADPRTEKDREKIRAELYETAFKKQLHDWLEQLRLDAFVRINAANAAAPSTAVTVVSPAPVAPAASAKSGPADKAAADTAAAAGKPTPVPAPTPTPVPGKQR